MRAILLFLPLVFLCCSVQCQNSNFKIGLVKDDYLKYSPLDVEIFKGATWWAHWVNEQGGLVYNNSAHHVEVIPVDTSTPNPNLTVTYITNAYETLATVNKVNLILSPSISPRTQAAMKVSEKYKIVNLVGGCQTDSLFGGTNTSVFTSVSLNATVPPFLLELLVKKGAKTYGIFHRTDSIAYAQASGATKYLNLKGLTNLFTVHINVSTSDASVLEANLRQAAVEYLENANVDIFIYCSVQTEFPSIAAAIDHIRPSGVKSLVFLTGGSRYLQNILGLGSIGNNWYTYARFDASFKFGVSGHYGGTTAEFIESYSQLFGHPPDTFDALTASILMGYYHAVTICNCIDTPTITKTMKEMSLFETFANPLQFYNNGTNMHPQIIPMQYINGEGVRVTVDSLIYPIAWNASHSSMTTIISIVIPVAVGLLLAVLGAIYYIRRQRDQVVKALVQAEEGERRNYKIDFNDLSVGNLIGAGGFGFVYKGEYRGAEVAIKKLKQQIFSKAEMDKFAAESSVMVGLRHPNILLFMGACLETNNLCIITEYMGRGNLHDIIHNRKIDLSFFVLRNMIEDTLKGLQFIHSAGFIHRDLKSPNLLVDKNWTIKIADFGLSCVKNQSTDNDQISLLWSAPEVLENAKDCYTAKSDIYSVGIIMWELFARGLPYEDINAAAIARAVQKGTRPPVGEWHPTICGLMKKCWGQDPEERPDVKTARSIIEMIENNSNDNYVATLDKEIEKSIFMPSGNVTFVYTTVVDKEKLWEFNPTIMKEAIVLHNKVLREEMVSARGFEVKNDCDAFMVAFADSVQAAKFCLRVQTNLLEAEWSKSLLAHPSAKVEMIDGVLVFRGLCVNIGVFRAHSVTTTRNTITNEQEFVGNGEAMSAKLANFAKRGTIIMNPEMYVKVAIDSLDLDEFTIENLGSRTITTNNTAINVYSMVPKQLAGRNAAIEEFATDDGEDGKNSPTKFEFPARKEKWIIRQEDLEVLSTKIGTGSFGVVHLGNYMNKKVAVKQFVRQKAMGDTMLDLRAESGELRALNHRNVLKFEGICWKAPNICFVSEYAEQGSLFNVIHERHTPLSLQQKKQILCDIASGMSYLHSLHIIHRSLKSANLMVVDDGTVKVTDWGFTQLRQSAQTQTQVGTVAWTAPEIFDGEQYTEKSDLFSFGIVIWELFTGKKPWENTHSMKIVVGVLNGSRPPISNLPSDMPPALLQLMINCWAQSPFQRPSFPEVLRQLNEL